MKTIVIIIIKRAIERVIRKEAKILCIVKTRQRRSRAITLQGAIEKIPILLSQYWDNDKFDSFKINPYFGGYNNNFA